MGKKSRIHLSSYISPEKGVWHNKMLAPLPAKSLKKTKGNTPYITRRQQLIVQNLTLFSGGFVYDLRREGRE